jgi:hypothetical protein
MTTLVAVVANTGFLRRFAKAAAAKNVALAKARAII